MKKILFGIIFGVVVWSPLYGLENWTLQDRTLLPFADVSPSSMEVFESTMVSVRNDHVYQTTDGTTWTEIVDAQFSQVGFEEARFRLHGDYLYLFPSSSSAAVRIYRTDDLSTWENVFENGSFGAIGEIISFNSELYIFKSDGEVKKTTGLGDPITWVDVTTLANLGGLNPSATVYHDQLHVAATSLVVSSSDASLTEFQTKLYRTSDGTSWDLVSTLSTDTINTTEADELNQKLVCLDDTLFLRTNKLRTTTSSQSPYSWTENDQFGRHHFPMVIFDQLHMVSAQDPIYRLSPLGYWHISSGIFLTEAFVPALLEKPVQFGNDVFFPSYELYVLSKGLWNIQQRTVIQDVVYSGDIRVTLLSFLFEINGQESIEFDLVNQGTALAGTHIQGILPSSRNLYESQFNYAFYNVVRSDPQDSSRWQTISPIQVRDGDRMLVHVTIDSDSPAATIQLEVENIQTSNNPDFVLSESLIANALTEIVNIPPPPPIKDAEVFPQPARNEVRFQYDLASTSDVRIKIFDLNGTLVSEIKDLDKGSGSPVQTIWNTSDKSAGVYHALIQIKPDVGEERTIKKKVFIKK
ncbi:hypothetical protein BVX98_06635 [bacterium F11]|nr:hypothetical protein BVX98_06635 [bacterium F11]